MDSERRHQLGQNDLLNWMLECYEDVLRPNASLVSLCVLVGAVLVGSFTLYTRAAAARQAAEWSHYFEASSSPEPVLSLESFSSMTPTGAMGATARLTLAEVQLNTATQRAMTQRDEALALLTQARDNLNAARGLTKDAATLERIAYVEGMIHETFAIVRTTADKSRHDITAAIEAYRRAAGADGIYATAAASRAAALSQPLTQAIVIALATTPLPVKPDPLGVDVDTTTAPDATESLDIDKMLE